jgi:hypothetical protein
MHAYQLNTAPMPEAPASRHMYVQYLLKFSLILLSVL